MAPGSAPQAATKEDFLPIRFFTNEDPYHGVHEDTERMAEKNSTH